jgi:hypothetical protein
MIAPSSNITKHAGKQGQIISNQEEKKVQFIQTQTQVQFIQKLTFKNLWSECAKSKNILLGNLTYFKIFKL